jgi:uncharacterized membrane protein SpoIIM required for sporulation
MEQAIEIIAGIVIVGAGGWFCYKFIWPSLKKRIDR